MKRFALFLVAIAAATVVFADDVTFTALDVYVESEQPLAAWQFELQDRNGVMQVVGVENGESRAFDRAPYYDREAVNLGRADRIIVADYTLADEDELPTGRVRVATLHLMLTGTQTPVYQVSLIAAARPDGRRLDATISVETTARKEL
jgi:hypothetical protein